MLREKNKTKAFEAAIMSFRDLSFWRSHRLCLAISGGADSTALLCAFAELAGRNGFLDRLVVCHVNHQVRGAESDGDEEFVRTLSKAKGIAFDGYRLNPTELKEEVQAVGSWESAARNLRYRALRTAAGRFGARYLLTAHTKDDQLETILYRIFRGTGLDGLQAIPAIRPIDEALTIVRPILTQSRTDVIQYLKELGQMFREDSSNAQTQYARNKIRHQLIPVLEELFPNRWRGALLRLAANAVDCSRLVDELTDSLLDPAVLLESRNNEFRFSKQLLADVPDSLICAFFRRFWTEQNWHLAEMGRSQWTRLTELVRSVETAVAEFPGGIVVRASEDELYIAKKIE